MKLIRYLSPVIICLGLFSCNIEEFDEIDNNKNKISFKVKNYFNQQKGIELTTSNFSKFNVYAYSSIGVMDTTSILNHFIDNLVVSNSNNTWDYTGEYYWPDSNYLHFFGIATHESSNSLPLGVSNWTKGATGYPYFTYTIDSSVANQKDLVVASSLNKQVTSPITPVNMNFEHILTKINISYIKNNGIPYTMTKIELLGVETSAIYTFNVVSGTWSNFTNTSTLVYWQGSQPFQQNQINLSENMFIIPQSNITLRFTFKTNTQNNVTQTATISPSQIGSNLRYNVIITL